MRLYIPILLSLFLLLSCSQRQFVIGKDPYEKDNHSILKSEMSDSLYQATAERNVKRSNRVVKTKRAAYEFAKPAFLKIEGKESVEGRLYAFYLVNGFWIVKGMLPEGFTGGTVVAVIDSESGELISTVSWR
ncbi:MAG: YbbC/YhhH family protein [Bacteroidetes bacterium]|jgi:hypothetical protein|nr:YbbC/YhhH family protein [Bacteroidota bacterium]MDF1866853.1 NTF2 fold immunity protein [Saprospiraceae bacterium]